jgi:hypothetical protein
VTTSHEIVVQARATSRALIRSPACSPMRTNSSSTVTAGSGTSVTSAITASIATVPTSGTRIPRTSASARLDPVRDQPSPKPTGRVEIWLGRLVVKLGP